MVNWGGEVMLTEYVLKQPLAPVAVTEYTPLHKPFKELLKPLAVF
jgi:hypothetical protein